jgi:probable O-glycosylation ligase (exosortase A-associated)
MPPAFWARVDSIQNYHSDASFQGRVEAWHVAYDYAVDHFPFGAGFYGPQLHEIFHKYEPGKIAHAAHSIYFQVLGEHGFVGLAIYLCIFVASFFDLQKVKWETKRRPELRWAYDLADMLQLSLFAFSLGGAALSMAYYDLFVLAICLGVALRVHVRSGVALAPFGNRSLPESKSADGVVNEWA